MLHAGNAIMLIEYLKRMTTGSANVYVRKIFACTVGFIALSAACSGQVRCDSIAWSLSRPLTWKDFKGVPDSSSLIGALSHISFKYHLEREKSKITLSTFTFFQPCTSWVDSSSISSLSLAHEQTHFNIDELARRSFVRDVSASSWLNEKQLIRNCQHLYFQSMLSRQLMHKMYDLQTDYHRNESEQKAWNEKVLKMIAGLWQYASNRQEEGEIVRRQE